MKYLKYDKIDTGEYQNRAIIMIHGWQGNKDSFKSIAKLLKVDNTRWFFPEAPYSIDGKDEKKTWAYEKSPGEWEVDKSKRMLKEFILDKVLNQFDSKDVFIMGFSQGAAACYELILSFKYPLGGIFPIAGFMRDFPGQGDKIKIEVSPSQKHTPILIGHGRDDDIVSVKASEKTYNLLKEKCKNVKLYIYNGKHKINVSYLNKVKELILERKQREDINGRSI